MALLPNIISGLRSLFQKKRADCELDEELRGFMDMAAEESIKHGRTPKDARRAVRLERGSLESAKELVRTARWESLLETFWQDVRYALRMLRKSPAFTAVTILTLALGIGANTAIFSVIDAVLLRALPYPNSNRVVMIFLQDPSLGLDRGAYGIADFLALRQQQHSFNAVAALSSPHDGFTLAGGQSPEEIPGTAVTGDFFTVLGARPIFGRTFLPDEDQPGHPPVVVVSEHFFREHLRGDPASIGNPITLDGTSYTVVGVMPANFLFGRNDGDQLWPILQLHAEVARPPFFLNILGCLKKGTPPNQASADASRIAAGVTEKYPKSDRVTSVAVPMKEVLVGSSRAALLVILGAVGFVLLIAVVNVANLQVARAAARQKEMAIRGALGASPGRLVRQLLTESVLLALIGAAIGLALAHWGLAAIISLSPGVVPRMDEIALNTAVLLYTLGIATFAGVLFGLTPVLRLREWRVTESLGGKGSSERVAVRAC